MFTFIQNSCFQAQIARSVVFVSDICLSKYCRRVLRNLGSSNESAPFFNMRLIRNYEPNVPVYPWTTVPSRISILGMVDSYRQYVPVIPEFQVRWQIITEPYIAIWTFTQEMSIEPHFAVLVNPIKPNRDFFFTVLSGNSKRLSVPSNPARQISLATWVVFTVRSLNAPVMRQVDIHPS